MPPTTSLVSNLKGIEPGARVQKWASRAEAALTQGQPVLFAYLQVNPDEKIDLCELLFLELPTSFKKTKLKALAKKDPDFRKIATKAEEKYGDAFEIVLGVFAPLGAKAGVFAPAQTSVLAPGELKKRLKRLPHARLQRLAKGCSVVRWKTLEKVLQSGRHGLQTDEAAEWQQALDEIKTGLADMGLTQKELQRELLIVSTINTSGSRDQKLIDRLGKAFKLVSSQSAENVRDAFAPKRVGGLRPKFMTGNKRRIADLLAQITERQHKLVALARQLHWSDFLAEIGYDPDGEEPLHPELDFARLSMILTSRAMGIGSIPARRAMAADPPENWDEAQQISALGLLLKDMEAWQIELEAAQPIVLNYTQQVRAALGSLAERAANLYRNAQEHEHEQERLTQRIAAAEVALSKAEDYPTVIQVCAELEQLRDLSRGNLAAATSLLKRRHLLQAHMRNSRTRPGAELRVAFDRLCSDAELLVRRLSLATQRNELQVGDAKAAGEIIVTALIKTRVKQEVLDPIEERIGTLEALRQEREVVVRELDAVGQRARDEVDGTKVATLKGQFKKWSKENNGIVQQAQEQVTQFVGILLRMKEEFKDREDALAAIEAADQALKEGLQSVLALSPAAAKATSAAKKWLAFVEIHSATEPPSALHEKLEGVAEQLGRLQAQLLERNGIRESLQMVHDYPDPNSGRNLAALRNRLEQATAELAELRGFGRALWRAYRDLATEETKALGRQNRQKIRTLREGIGVCEQFVVRLRLRAGDLGHDGARLFEARSKLEAVRGFLDSHGGMQQLAGLPAPHPELELDEEEEELAALSGIAKELTEALQDLEHAQEGDPAAVEDVYRRASDLVKALPSLSSFQLLPSKISDVWATFKATHPKKLGNVEKAIKALEAARTRVRAQAALDLGEYEELGRCALAVKAHLAPEGKLLAGASREALKAAESVRYRLDEIEQTVRTARYSSQLTHTSPLTAGAYVLELKRRRKVWGEGYRLAQRLGEAFEQDSPLSETIGELREMAEFCADQVLAPLMAMTGLLLETIDLGNGLRVKPNALITDMRTLQEKPRELYHPSSYADADDSGLFAEVDGKIHKAAAFVAYCVKLLGAK